MGTPSRYSQDMYEEFSNNGLWTTKTLADMWDENARRFPDRDALVDSMTRLTWAQAKLWIDRLALGLLELGLKKDDMLVVQLPNSVELTLLRVATERAGLLCLPVLRTLRHREMEYILKAVDALGVVVLREFRGFNYIDMLDALKPSLPKLKHVFVAGDDPPEGTVSVTSMVKVSEWAPASVIPTAARPVGL